MFDNWLFNNKFNITENSVNRFGVIALFLHEQPVGQSRGLTKSPWLIIDDSISVRSGSPVPERFYYYIWNAIFSEPNP